MTFPNSRFRRLPFILIILICTPTVFASTTLIDLIPDFTQTDVNEEGTGDGQQYCAPVAVSNSFSWWLEYGYEEQKEMIVELGSSDYMNTDTNSGTGTVGLMNGVSKYAMKKFSGYKQLEYEGRRKHPNRFASTTKIPDIKRIRSAVSYRSTAWLNIGWYKDVEGTDDFKRVGGHWVTLVGATENQLVLHDPAPRAGQRFSNEFVSFEPIGKGKLTGNKLGLPISAKGYLKLKEGMHIKSSADHAIVDGVVYFTR